MTNPTVDPALAENLAQLAEMAREIGAAQIYLVRDVRGAALQLHLHPIQEQQHITVSVSTHLPLPDAGSLLVICFPAGDGGTMPVEAL